MGKALPILFVVLSVPLVAGCGSSSDGGESRTVPHQERYGIYVLEVATGRTRLIVSFAEPVSNLRLNHAGTAFAFSRPHGGTESVDEEIWTVGVDGLGLTRLTHNSYPDYYPCWSPDDTQLGFLAQPTGEPDLDLFTMNADGSDVTELYDSGMHDADLDWYGSRVVFTTDSRLWTVMDDGSNPEQLTNPPNAGQSGVANLPIGDYDPRFSPDGTRIVFDRMVDVSSEHGSYDIFVINADGTGETRLTSTGYTQGFPHWSHAGTEIVLTVAAIEGEGKFDIYRMNADGSNLRNITPDYYPPTFLCRIAVFSPDDALIYFVGEWYE